MLFMRAKLYLYGGKDMGVQHKVTKKQPLLNDKGNIQEPGYALNQVWHY